MLDFKNWTISKKLFLLAVMNFTVLAAVIGLSNTTIQKLGSKLESIGTNDLPAIRSMALTDMFHDALRAAVLRAFVATYQKHPAELVEARKEYDEFSKDIEKHIQNISNLNVDAKMKQHAESSIPEVKAYVSSGDKILKLLEAGREADAVALQPEYQKSFEALEAKLEVLGDLIEKETATSLASDNEAAKTAGLLLAVVGCALSLLVPFLLGRNLVSILNGIVSQMDRQKSALEKYTVQIEQAAKGLSASAASQASAIQQSAAAVEEISQMVARTADNSKNLTRSAEQSDKTAGQGRQAVLTMLDNVAQIKDSNVDVKTQIEQGNNEVRTIVEVIQEIGQKTKVINDIVFQTKLLSFNASVEAARAGEHGKGFAVVAEEVGNLAQMSGNAAKEISELLENSVRQVNEIVTNNSEKVSVLLENNSEKVEGGRESAEHCDESFQTVASQVSEVRRLTGEITTAIQEQTTGLQEINRAMGLFNAAIQENAGSAHAASEVASRLREQFEMVDVLMSDLGRLVNGNDRNAA